MRRLSIFVTVWASVSACNCNPSPPGGDDSGHGYLDDGGTCVAAGAPCMNNVPCCGGACGANNLCTASTFCKAAGSVCTANTECCLGGCTNGTCGGSACKDVGAACGA